MQSRNARLGLQLFTVYLVLYAGFVGLNAFAPEKMESTPVAGLNLAILYGFGLIIGALVLSLIYGVLCHNTETAGHNADTVGRTTDAPKKESNQ